MAFENVGLEPGIEIWRIEDFEAIPYDNHGKFHMGDSYIVLKVNMTLKLCRYVSNCFSFIQCSP